MPIKLSPPLICQIAIKKHYICISNMFLLASCQGSYSEEWLARKGRRCDETLQGQHRATGNLLLAISGNRKSTRNKQEESSPLCYYRSSKYTAMHSLIALSPRVRYN